MKILIFLTSVVLTLFLSGCTIVIGNPQTTTSPSQTELTTVPTTEPTTIPTTVPPTEATTVPTTPAPTTVATQPPTPAPTSLPIQKKTVRKTEAPKPAPKPVPKTTKKPVPKPAPKPTPNKNNTNKTISASAAQNAALSHAGVKASDARGLRVKPDYDDGRFEYEVEFYANGFEYDYEIDGNSGRIISYDKDRD